MIPSTSFPTLGVGDGQDLSPAEATKRPLSGRRNPKPAALTSTLGNQCQDSHQHHPSAEVWECGLHPQALAETVWGLTRTWKPRPVALRRNSRPRGPCGARPGLTPPALYLRPRAGTGTCAHSPAWETESGTRRGTYPRRVHQAQVRGLALPLHTTRRQDRAEAS